jgi:hypothetical protein
MTYLFGKCCSAFVGAEDSMQSSVARQKPMNLLMYKDHEQTRDEAAHIQPTGVGQEESGVLQLPLVLQA